MWVRKAGMFNCLKETVFENAFPSGLSSFSYPEDKVENPQGNLEGK